MAIAGNALEKLMGKRKAKKLIVQTERLGVALNHD